MLRKTIGFGKVDYNGNGRKTNLVTLELELRTKKEGLVFSCSGNVWNNRKTDIYSGGQILEELKEMKLNNKALFDEIYNIWGKYHLNDMNAGSIKQDQALKEEFGEIPSYSVAKEFLSTTDLEENYIYGSKWLFRAIPKETINRIKEIIK